ncbi:cytochrome c oxidase subunit II [Paraburkholderia graminis]|uniref:cytochrome c oxidase subunit II n=1 Tax=Paraburkholderia graminis TaxID=60548 RepID=UPI003899FD14
MTARVVLPLSGAAAIATATGTVQSAWAAPLQDALRPAGVQASTILDLLNLTVIVCTAVFAAVLIAFFWALWRAPRGTRETPADISTEADSAVGPKAVAEPGLRRAVIVATIVSTVLLFGLIFADVLTDRALARLSMRDAVQIEVTAHQWWWEIRYNDPQASNVFITANEMHIPVGQPVLVTLKSSDVIHSFWVPNLHGKKDLIPGRTATIRFRADHAGEYRGQCAEFCGYEHALMSFLVIAETPDKYAAWLAHQRQDAPPPSNELETRGEQIFLTHSCAMCHTVQGIGANAVLGPDLTHVASRQTLAAGTLPNTPGHLAGWIVDAQRIKPGTVMPPNPLAPDELHALLAYMATLR